MAMAGRCTIGARTSPGSTAIRTPASAHARLSIIDLATGQQPMCNEDGDALGRLQRRDLQLRRAARRAARARAHVSGPRATPRSSSTPTRRWGDAAFARFNGQFAIALWDAQRQRAGARARPARRAPAATVRARRARSGSPARSRRSSPATRPSRARSIPCGLGRDLHVLVDRAAADASSTASTELRARATCAPIDATARSREHATGRRATRAAGRPLPRLARRAAEAVRDALEAGDPAADAARRRAGRQLPLRRARQLAGRGARAGARRASRFHDVLAALRRRRVRRDALPADDGRAPRQRAPRGRRLARATSPTRSPTWSATPSGRCCAPRRRRLFLLSQLVREAGIKVVLTGEGADEMFAGYDIFREGKVRRFWARQPESTMAPAAARAALSVPGALAGRRSGRWRRQFFGRELDVAPSPASPTRTRWRSTAALQRLFCADMRRQPTEVATSTRRLIAMSAARVRATGHPSPRTSTWRCARCCPATCCRRRATGC